MATADPQMPVQGDQTTSAHSANSPSDVPTEEPILPDSYWGGDAGTIPIFKPTMDQFRSFPDFIKKIDHYGMKSGIVKVIPPQEWLDQLPDLDDKVSYCLEVSDGKSDELQVKDIRVQSAIEQNFAGSGGAFRQMNLEKHRSYTLPQWRKICDSMEHQPPAKRGEARGVGGRKQQQPKQQIQHPVTPPATTDSDSGSPEPQSNPKSKKEKSKGRSRAKDTCDDMEPADFDYRIDDNDQYTAERCQELERSYWKSLTFNNPMYGADLPGSLFTDDIKEWNVAHLDNILNRLGVTLPGVNSAYLYLGMWKATFSWHVEDMDLYSINYIHFGAPKQWYSVSQEDNQKFEKVMKDIFPNDARHCGQFMRHKTFGASPARLAQHDLHVNKLVHYEKEFVITFPYGYHSGYNLGYNCAESVNFATEEWLEYGKVAQKCNCVTDAVSIDVNDIIKAVNGGDSSDYDEQEDMPTPPASDHGSNEESPERRTYSEFDRLRRTNKRKRNKDLIYESAPVVQYKKLSDKYHGRTPATQISKPVTKKIKLTLPKAPCALCARAPRYEDLLDAGEGRKVHRVCAEFVPETKIVTHSEAASKDTVTGMDTIDKARMALKCSHCKLTVGACFQCSSPKCVRAFHGSCAYEAGVLVQKLDVSDEQPLSFHFLCKTHRPRRPPVENLEFDANITHFASALQVNQTVQVQFTSGHSFAGLVRENRRSERALLIEVGNEGDKIEVDYQWVLASPKKTVPSPRSVTVNQPPVPIGSCPAQQQVPRASMPQAGFSSSHAAPGNHTQISYATPPGYVNPYMVAQGYYKPAPAPQAAPVYFAASGAPQRQVYGQHNVSLSQNSYPSGSPQSSFQVDGNAQLPTPPRQPFVQNQYGPRQGPNVVAASLKPGVTILPTP